MNLLSPLGMLYGRVMDIRNRMYDRGSLRSHSLGAWTVSIGNLTAGGTGKTPLVALTAGILAENGETVCVLTRGYGRANEKERVLVSDGETVFASVYTGGDEPVELGGKLLGKAIVLADANRIGAAKWAKEKFGITAFVLDDGFQHRRAKRDVDIVCIDATDPCGNGRLLPAGTLRESFKHLRRADAIVLTRTNLVDTNEAIMERLRKRNSSVPIIGAATKITQVIKFEDFAARTHSTTKEKDFKLSSSLLAFCGLGNPGNFRKQLKRENFRVAGFRSFGDHHQYNQGDINKLEHEAAELSAECLITTAKDAVKLNGLRFRIPVFVAEAEVVMDDVDLFRQLVSRQK